MSAKPKFDLAAAVNDTVGRSSTLDVQKLANDPGQPPAPAPTPAKEKKQAARIGAKGITIWLQPDLWKRLKQHSLDTDQTIQDMVESLIAERFGPKN